ncbi:MAG: LCP family protein [Ilumatobacteraceae bacterium]
MPRYEPPARSSGLDDLERRLRGPDIDEGSADLQMTTSALVPGAATFRRTPWLGVVLLVAGLVLPIGVIAWVVARRSDLVGLTLDPRFLAAVTTVSLVSVVARLVAVGEVTHAFRRTPGIGGKTAVAVVLVLAFGSPVLWIALRADQARHVVDHVFARDDGDPVFAPVDVGAGVDPRSVTTILLLGNGTTTGVTPATGTITLLTVDRASSRVALVSIPDDLTDLRFPPDSPFAARYPGGVDDLGGAVTADATPRAEPTGLAGIAASPGGALALTEAIGYSLDVQIDDYAIIEMQGLAGLVDAVGGVTVEVTGSVPLLPGGPGGPTLPATVGPGPVDMDGALVSAYVRPRSSDSGDDPVVRQRQVLSAVGDELSADDLIGGFGTMAGVLDDSLRTSMSTSEFARLIDGIGDVGRVQESVRLSPPLVMTGSPDYDLIRRVVDAVQSAVVTGTPSGFATP